jgi:hypothetical protein
VQPPSPSALTLLAKVRPRTPLSLCGLPPALKAGRQAATFAWTHQHLRVTIHVSQLQVGPASTCGIRTFSPTVPSAALPGYPFALTCRLRCHPIGNSAVADEGAGDAGKGGKVLGFAVVASVESAAASESNPWCVQWSGGVTQVAVSSRRPCVRCGAGRRAGTFIAAGGGSRGPCRHAAFRACVLAAAPAGPERGYAPCEPAVGRHT